MEHVFWTRLFIVSAAFNLPDLQVVTERLLQNPEDFAMELKPLYGEAKAAQFNRLFTEHLTIAAALVNAAKAGDSAEVEKQRKLWYANADAIARFLASINRCWSEREWRRLFYEHLRMTEDEAVFMLAGKYLESVDVYDEIEDLALLMADVMTLGIIRQFCIV